MKLGEKLMFGFAVVATVAAIAQGVNRMNTSERKKPRDYYEWTEAGLQGHTLYRQMGCNSCHRALGVGEIGVAPVLDGTGTKRSLEWLQSYMDDPETMVPGTAHNGSLGPDFRKFDEPQKELLVAFLFALKANPGSPNYPRPPVQAVIKD